VRCFSGALAEAHDQCRHGLEEEAEATFDMRLVLTATRVGPDPQGVAKRGVHLLRMVRATVVQDDGEWRLVSGRDPIVEGFDHGSTVLAVAH